MKQMERNLMIVGLILMIIIIIMAGVNWIGNRSILFDLIPLFILFIFLYFLITYFTGTIIGGGIGLCVLIYRGGRFPYVSTEYDLGLVGKELGMWLFWIVFILVISIAGGFLEMIGRAISKRPVKPRNRRRR